ncbi:MAG: hypothetical protein ACOH2T_29215 [Pseudomonas sp.]
MLHALWDHTLRLRTWIINALSLLILALPDIIDLLSGANLDGIIPDQYVRAFAIGLAIVNIWMRPRPAVIKKDIEQAAAEYPHEHV